MAHVDHIPVQAAHRASGQPVAPYLYRHFQSSHCHMASQRSAAIWSTVTVSRTQSRALAAAHARLRGIGDHYAVLAP
uniref:Uncharacterized protein n=1 Tax=Oryza meridionalis TaxID=40149 RepID=A0A0E0D6H8_9ORYZ